MVRYRLDVLCMGMNWKRKLAGTAGFLGAAIAGLYGYWVWALADRGPIMLIACLESDPGFVAWHCRCLLQHVPLQADHVRELNLAAGVRFAVAIKDPALASYVAASFIRQGVDINAPDVHYGPKGFTALHGAAVGAELEEARVLLELGARSDVQDAEGRTPLDIARAAARRHPNEVRRSDMVALLERAAGPVIR